MFPAESKVALSTWRFTTDQLQLVREGAPGWTVVQRNATTPADVDAALDEHPDAAFLYTGAAPSRPVRPVALRALQWHSSGTETLREKPAWNWDVAIASGSGVNSISVAEMTLSGILAFKRHWPEIHAHQQLSRWPADRLALAGTELHGRHAVIIGYGSIGRAIARLLYGFGVRLTAVVASTSRRRYTGFTPSQSGDPEGLLPQEWVTFDQVEAPIASADLIVIATDKFEPITAQHLASAKLHPLLVNVARGSAVDQDALPELLARGELSGAYLDVFNPEPLPPANALWNQPNCLISPHMAGTTRDVGKHAAELLVTNLLRLEGGARLVNQLDPSALAKHPSW